MQFTDGCSSQFKSKLPFQHLSETKTHNFEKSYFGSKHGKGPCDALGGIIKKQAEMYVRTWKGSIQDDKALFEFCDINLTINTDSKCQHKKSVLLLRKHKEGWNVKPSHIERNTISPQCQMCRNRYC